MKARGVLAVMVSLAFHFGGLAWMLEAPASLQNILEDPRLTKMDPQLGARARDGFRLLDDARANARATPVAPHPKPVQDKPPRAQKTPDIVQGSKPEPKSMPSASKQMPKETAPPIAASATGTSTKTTTLDPQKTKAYTDFGLAVRRAYLASINLPKNKRGGGVVRLHFVNGRFAGARLDRSTGEAVLDRALLDAARMTRYPNPPLGLDPDVSYIVAVSIK